MQTASIFRSDINGLRAWAVIAVVCYHFKLAGFTGGFVGVDIFFVISGFLMTGIVSRGLVQDNLSLKQFYRARALRIAPALLLVCTSCLIAGYFILFDEEYRALFMQTVYSLLFISNSYFNTSGDYFNNGTQLQPLLHTWSLAIEWQFYLLLPIALLLATRIKRGVPSQIATLVLLSALSLTALIYSQLNQQNSFYLLATRSWELLLGGLVYFASLKFQPSPVTKTLAFYGGFSLIIIAITTTPAQDWPNTLAIMPLLGTCLILLAAKQNSPLTDNTIAKHLGNWSYSIYLWHWPIWVYLILVVEQPSPAQKGIAIAISIALAAATYFSVEKYFLNKHRDQRLRFSLLATLYCLILIGCVWIYKTADFRSRISPEVQQTLNSSNDKNPFIRSCSYKENSPKPNHRMPCTLQAGELSYINPDIILLGDSHAAAIAQQLSINAPDLALKMYTAYACPPILGLQSLDQHYSCPQLLPNMLREISAQHPGLPVIIYSRLNSYFEGANETKAAVNMDLNKLMVGNYVFGDDNFKPQLAQQLTSTLCHISHSNPVTVILPTPELGFDPVTRIARDQRLNRAAPHYGVALATHKQRSTAAFAALKQAQQQCGIRLFDPTPHLCQNGFCSANDDQRMRYFDDDHLSQYGASLFASELINALNLPQ